MRGEKGNVYCWLISRVALRHNSRYNTFYESYKLQIEDAFYPN